jgi:hypothetical protein
MNYITTYDDRVKVAEGVGFEPTEGLHPQQFSRLPHSTALPPLRSGRVELMA